MWSVINLDQIFINVQGFIAQAESYIQATPIETLLGVVSPSTISDGATPGMF